MGFWPIRVRARSYLYIKRQSTSVKLFLKFIIHKFSSANFLLNLWNPASISTSSCEFYNGITPLLKEKLIRVRSPNFWNMDPSVKKCIIKGTPLWQELFSIKNPDSMHSNRTLFSREEMFCLRKAALQDEKKKRKHVSKWKVCHQHCPLHTLWLQLKIENFSDWANRKRKLRDVGSPFWQTINIVYWSKLVNQKSHYNLWQSIWKARWGNSSLLASIVVSFARCRLFLLFDFPTRTLTIFAVIFTLLNLRC